MMYRLEAPKPVLEPGFILPLIGCAALYWRAVFQFGRSAPDLCSKYYRPKPFFFFFFFWERKRLVCSLGTSPAAAYGH